MLVGVGGAISDGRGVGDPVGLGGKYLAGIIDRATRHNAKIEKVKIIPGNCCFFIRCLPLSVIWGCCSILIEP